MRIYHVPQMPDPMPPPSTLPDELQEEIRSRDSRMAESGRDPHKDSHGRKYTHKLMSNVSTRFMECIHLMQPISPIWTRCLR